jgi:tetratricopeptide (TPR) repeat protein
MSLIKTHKIFSLLIFFALTGARFVENRTPVAEYGPVFYKLGLEEEKKFHIPKAIRYYKNVVRYEPGHVDAYWHLSEIYLGRQDYDAAIQYAQQAVNLNSWYPKAYNVLGLAYRAKKQFRSALLSFQRALVWPFPPGAPQYIFNIGLTSLDLNDTVLAVEQVKVLHAIGENRLAQKLQDMIPE